MKLRHHAETPHRLSPTDREAKLDVHSPVVQTILLSEGQGGIDLLTVAEANVGMGSDRRIFTTPSLFLNQN